MSGGNNREEIRQFLEEQFGVVEEQGAVATVGMVHHAHSGPVELHAMAAGHGKWNNAEAMAFTFDSIATRHARGVSSGGAQQYEIHVTRGGDKRQTAVLPFVRVGSANLVGPNGSLATEPPTQVGQTSQAMRLLEQFAQGSFAQNKDNIETLKFLLKELIMRLKDTEENNRDLWVNLKGVLIELQKQTHEQKLKEITAQRMAEFQRQVIKLAPSLLNMMAGREVFPLSTADTQLIETIAEVATPSDLQMLQAGVMGKPGGEKIAGLLADRFAQARKRAAEDKANEDRLMAGRQAVSWDEAERDAAGMAMRALKGQSLDMLPEGTAARAAAEALNPVVRPLECVTPSHHSNGDHAQGGTNGHATPSAQPVEMLDGLFAALGGQSEMMLGMLAERDPDLAARMRAYQETLKKKVESSAL